jgi:transcriptional regulator with XRE-family HTH domain
LAGISNDYYIRLERGKETRPSPEVIDALAGALRLEPDEHEHLRSLAALAARRVAEAPPAPSAPSPTGSASCSTAFVPTPRTSSPATETS